MNGEARALSTTKNDQKSNLMRENRINYKKKSRISRRRKKIEELCQMLK